MLHTNFILILQIGRQSSWSPKNILSFRSMKLVPSFYNPSQECFFSLGRQTVTALPSHTCCAQSCFKALIHVFLSGILSFPFYISEPPHLFTLLSRSCVSHLLQPTLMSLFPISICVSVGSVLCSR